MLQENVMLPSIGGKARGEVTVELLDDKGNTVQKEKNSNFISKGMDYVYYAIMANLFTMNKATDGTTQVPDPFRCMTLTTATHEAEPSSEWLMRGDMVGWAYTSGTYSGSDVYRGSYNNVESFYDQEDGRLRVVVDFPTHAANGDIGSVYFSGNNYNISNSIGVRDEYMNGAVRIINPLGNIRKVQKHNNWIYMVWTNYIAIANDNFEIVARFSISGNYVYDICVVGDTIYMLQSNSIKTLNVNDVDSNLELNDFDSLLLLGINSPRGMIYDSDEEVFYISSSGSNLYKYSKDFTLLDTITLTMELGNNERLLLTDSSIISNNFIIGKDGSVVYMGNNIHVSGVIDNNILTRDGYLLPKIGFSSRAVLSSPVKKTSQYAMKVTYDFLLPSVFEA